jgi:putative ABC transport system permease protein
MTIISSIKNSLKLMRANKARTSLTLLGLVIGIMTVIIVFAAGEGIRGLVLGQVESFGTDTVITEIKVPSTKTGSDGESESGSAQASGVQVTTLTLDDMDAVEMLPNVEQGYGAVLSQEQASYGNELRRAFIMGTSAEYIEIDSGSTIASGRFFSESEDKSLATVAVIGKGMKEKLFGDNEAIGKTIKLRNERFTVIGVMAPRGAVMFMSFDDYIYVPIRTLQKKLMGTDYISYMVHKITDVEASEPTAEDIRYTMRQRHDITDPVKDDFRVTTMVESVKTLETITNALTFLLLAIVAISLVVGGVGIMNIMYVAVTERTMEIGLRKAVGASYKDILQQFLVEAVIITLMGGVVGSILGTLIAYLISLVASALGFDWHFAIPLQAYIIAISFSLVCGIAFGVTPARSAAKLDPIEALRTE